MTKTISASRLSGCAAFTGALAYWTVKICGQRPYFNLAVLGGDWVGSPSMPVGEANRKTHPRREKQIRVCGRANWSFLRDLVPRQEVL